MPCWSRKGKGIGRKEYSTDTDPGYRNDVLGKRLNRIMQRNNVQKVTGNVKIKVKGSKKVKNFKFKYQ